MRHGVTAEGEANDCDNPINVPAELWSMLYPLVQKS